MSWYWNIPLIILAIGTIGLITYIILKDDKNYKDSGKGE
jgi:hypothetical protein